MAKGVVHIEMLGRDWIQDQEGQAQMVKRLPKILKKMLGNDETWASTVFTDRGPGFYWPLQGTICPKYLEALTECGFTPWAGEHAKWQPPDIPDLLLHETVVAWIRKFLRQHPIRITENMARNIENLGEKLAEAQEHINEHYEVEDRWAQVQAHRGQSKQDMKKRSYNLNN